SGDECLRELGRRCSRIAEEVLVARFGGEVIVVMLPGRDLAQASTIDERNQLRSVDGSIAHPTSLVAGDLTVSIGGDENWPDLDTDPARLVAAADRALYAAKAGGRNRVVAVEG